LKSPAFYWAIWHTLNSLYNMWHMAQNRSQHMASFYCHMLISGREKTASPVLRGAGANWCMVAILWHLRETRRQTEKTNLNLQHRKKPVYSTPLDSVAQRIQHTAFGTVERLFRHMVPCQSGAELRERHGHIRTFHFSPSPPSPHTPHTPGRPRSCPQHKQ